MQNDKDKHSHYTVKSENETLLQDLAWEMEHLSSYTEWNTATT